MALTEKQMNLLAAIFLVEDNGSPDITIDAKTIMRVLKKDLDYGQPHRIIRDALREGFLYVDDVDEKGRFFLGLTDWGEETWYEIELSLEEDDE